MLLLRRLKVSWILMGSVCCYQSSQFTHVLVGGRWLLDKCWYTNPRLSFSAATTRVAVTQFHFHNSSLLTTRACCSAGSWQWLPLTKQLLLICLLRHGLGRGFCCWWTIRIHDWEYKRASSSRRGSDETRHRIHSNVTLFSTPKGNVWSCTNIPYLPLLLSWQPGRCSVFSSERSLRKESSLRKWCASSTNSSAALYSALIYWFIYWHVSGNYPPFSWSHRNTKKAQLLLGRPHNEATVRLVYSKWSPFYPQTFKLFVMLLFLKWQLAMRHEVYI